MRYLILAATLLATTACQEQHKLDIPSAKTKAALALSAFECSHLAVDQADSSRLFSLGLNNGREFLGFAESNPNGYKSIQPELDPIWNTVAARPSADFKLGEIHAATINQIYSYRGRWDDRNWDIKRAGLYKEKNCAFLGSAPAPR